MPEPVLSQTKSWTRRSLKFHESSTHIYKISANPPINNKVVHYADDISVLHHDQNGKKETVEFNRSRIRSIELQNTAEFYSSDTKPFRYQLINRKMGSNKNFAKLYNINEKLVDEAIDFWPIVIVVFSLLVWFIATPTIVDIEEFIINALDNRVIREPIPIIWPIAYILAVPPAIVAGLIAKKNWPEPIAHFWYDERQEWNVVYYMIDGERPILASVYRDKTEAMRMHTDHLNALQAAKLAEKSNSAKTNDDADEYL